MTENTKKDELMPGVDEQEYQAAMEQAKESAAVYTYEFPAPYTYEGESFDKLTFDFGQLTAEDSLKIEAELSALGQPLLVPEFSGEYLLRMAMRACTDKKADDKKLGLDFFRALPLSAYVKIRGRARSFLLRAGS